MKLDKINILVADADAKMSNVLAHMLRQIGFGGLHVVKDGDQAIQVMSRQDIDILITEWQMDPIDGPALISQIRRGDDSRQRLVPIIMLTARAERQDVEAARDIGINEFVVKPFNTRTVFDKIQQVIDNPRSFIVCPNYVGPDRRRKAENFNKNEERRKLKPKPIAGTDVDINKDYYSPRIVPVENIIKQKLGISDSIDTIITPEILEKAQQALDALKEESLQWIKEAIAKLEEDYNGLMKQPSDRNLFALMDSLLYIKGRAGTFGFTHMSEAAQMTYKFMREDYVHPLHNEALLISLRSIKVLFAENLLDDVSASGDQLLLELRALLTKYRSVKKPG